MTRDDIFDLIHEERARQQAKWGGEHPWGHGDCSEPSLPSTVKTAVLTEECGEVARAVLERDTDALTVELVQVAAVAVAWLESMEPAA